MHSRFKWFLVWAVFLGAYVTGWQASEGLKGLGMAPQVALAMGVIAGLLVLGTVGLLYFKWKRSRYTTPQAVSPDGSQETLADDVSGLTDAQQQLMGALQQGLKNDGDIVIRGTGGENPGYVLETDSLEDEQPSNS